MMLVDPAGNSLLKFTTRTSAGAVLPADAMGSGADAGDIMIGSLVFERWIDLGTLRNCARASRMKSATGRRMQRARNRTRDRLQTAMPAAVDAGNRFEQSARVRVERISKQLPSRRLFHHARRVKNRNVVGILGDDSKIVRDQDYGEAEPHLQLANQVENL